MAWKVEIEKDKQDLRLPTGQKNIDSMKKG